VVERLTAPARAFATTSVAVVAFGVAMGFLEAAVVVYLRAAIGLGPPGLIPAHDPATFGTFEGVEVTRELATLVMIAAVGWLAGPSPLERLAWASIAFGVWDIVYYAGLRALIGWPPALDGWDVLFLVPVPWVAPVWAPIVVSTALIGVGLAAARRLRAGRGIRVGWIRALIVLTGGALVVMSFVVDAGRVLGGDVGSWAAWPLFWAGMALAAGGTLPALANAPGRSQMGNSFRDEPDGRRLAG